MEKEIRLFFFGFWCLKESFIRNQKPKEELAKRLNTKQEHKEKSNNNNCTKGKPSNELAISS